MCSYFSRSRLSRTFLPFSQLTNDTPRNPMIKPINGLDIASGIASRNGSPSRVRMREVAFAAELIGFIHLEFTIARSGSVLDLSPTSGT